MGRAKKHKEARKVADALAKDVKAPARPRYWWYYRIPFFGKRWYRNRYVQWWADMILHQAGVRHAKRAVRKKVAYTS